MNLKGVKVTGLFHTFTHEIIFKHSGISIIIGENGVGKTTILKIIDSVFNKKFDYLFSFEFETINFYFDSQSWVITKQDSIKISSSLSEEEFVIDKSNDERYSPYYSVKRFFTQISDNVWCDMRNGRRLFREDIIARYNFDPLPISAKQIPEWFKSMVGINKVRLIQTQRLFDTEFSKDSESKGIEYMVNKFSKEIVEVLRKENALFTTTSVQLDSTFPIRLIQGNKENVLSQDIVSRMKELSTYRRLLSDVGIIEKQDDDLIDNIPAEKYSDNILSILSLYLDDTQKKLSVFEELAQKIQLLCSIINARYKHKCLSVNKDKGFVITSDSDKHEIELAKLSSGEQNELILFYSLLFKSEEDEMVLIDEPEISLHISWQQTLIKDLLDISKNNHLSMILATHSPDIIGDNWSLVTTLS